MVRSDLLNMADLVPARRRCYLWDGQRATARRALIAIGLSPLRTAKCAACRTRRGTSVELHISPKTWFGSTLRITVDVGR